jgi:hypothetical protein
MRLRVRREGSSALNRDTCSKGRRAAALVGQADLDVIVGSRAWWSHAIGTAAAGSMSGSDQIGTSRSPLDTPATSG